jgi:hypothetical protein
MNFPVIVVPPCEELQLAVEALTARRVAGTLKTLPPSYRQDLATLKSLCPTIPTETAKLLALLEALPDDESDFDDD